MQSDATAPDETAAAGEPMHLSLPPAERLEIHDMAALYGILIDDRDFAGLSRVFTDDAVFVIRPSRGRDEVRLNGLDAIRNFMDGANHPLAHHVTNVVAVADGPDNATMRSKVIATLPKARAGSADYRDRLRRTPRGWRIAERIVTLRTGDPPPP